MITLSGVRKRYSEARANDPRTLAVKRRTQLPLAVYSAPSLRWARWFFSVYLAGGVLAGVAVAVDPPDGTAPAAYFAGGIVAVLSLIGIVWLRPWSGKTDAEREAERTLTIAVQDLCVQRSPTELERVPHADVRAVVVYQALRAFRRNAYTRITIYYSHHKELWVLDCRWRQPTPKATTVFDMLGAAGYPAAIRTGLGHRRYRNSLAPEWAGWLLVPEPRGDPSTTTVASSDTTAADPEGPDPRVRVVDAAGGISAATFGRRRPVAASSALNVATIPLVVGLAWASPYLLVHGVQDVQAASTQHRLETNGVHTEGTISGVSVTNTKCSDDPCKIRLSVNYRYTVARPGAQSSHGPYEGHAMVRTARDYDYKPGKTLAVVYDPSDVATSFTPEGTVSTTDGVGQIVVGALFGVGVLGALYVGVGRLRRTPTPRSA